MLPSPGTSPRCRNYLFRKLPHTVGGDPKGIKDLPSGEHNHVKSSSVASGLINLSAYPVRERYLSDPPLSSSSSSHFSTMLTVNDAIHGWSPAGDDDVEVNVSQDMCFMTINPITSSSTFLSPICPPLNATLQKSFSPQSHSIPLPPSTGISYTTIAPSSDRRAQRNRNRDPSWIPRPRNAFIIFRCEYSREHAQSSLESHDDHDSNNACVKTLSKRAAEAWKQLSPSERDRYKVLADREREEHARIYPHYRFRPMKRQISGKSSSERSQSPNSASVERPPAPSTHLPSVLAAAPLGADYNGPVPFFPSPEATLPSDSSPHFASVEQFSPLGIPPDSYRCNDSAFGLDLTPDLERAQALEAYAIGLYNHDLFSPFSFPEYY